MSILQIFFWSAFNFSLPLAFVYKPDINSLIVQRRKDTIFSL